MNRCDSCRYQNDFEFHACHICHMERDMYRPKETNADRIRSMSDEELADFLAEQQLDLVETIYGLFKMPVPDYLAGVKDDALDWLRQEADHGHPD